MSDIWGAIEPRAARIFASLGDSIESAFRFLTSHPVAAAGVAVAGIVIISRLMKS
jgi:hypothetical protein